MKSIDVLAVTLNVTPFDLNGNLKKVRDAFKFIHDRDLPSTPPPKAKFILFPEFPISGHAGDLFNAPWFRQRVLDETLKFVDETRGITAVISLPLEVDGKLYRAALMAVDGTVLGFSCAAHIPTSLLRWFTPWEKTEEKRIQIGSNEYPVGDFTYEIADVRIRIAFAPEEKQTKADSADILAIPGADPFEIGKAVKRRKNIQDLSRQNESAVIFANLAGNEAGTLIYDGESLITESGSILAAERRFSYMDSSYLSAAIDLDEIRKSRSPKPAHLQKLEYKGIFDWGYYNERRFRHPGFYREADTGEVSLFEEWEKDDSDLPFEEFPRAVAAGLYDYLRKSKSGGFVLSLSGGADSAAIAVILFLMTAFGIAAVGKKRYLKSLSHIREIARLAEGDIRSLTPPEITAALLTTVYQKTANNSEITRRAAEGIAEAVGANHSEIQIDNLIDTYLKLASSAMGRPLSWETDDLALQNIQARSRGPAAWLLANMKGALLLATSNRSESACGYATMDGDTCGSISPIAGISKEFLRRWLTWIETTGPLLTPPLFDEDGLGDQPYRIPFPAVRLINNQQPTAELRPLATGQTDEADLMPYTVLDTIERGIVENRLFGKPLTQFVRAKLRAIPEFCDISDEQIYLWITKFERMFPQSQWKRYRYAPGFHLENEDLSPDFFRLPSLGGKFGEWN